MSRRRSPNQKKVFWTITALAAVFATLIFVSAAYMISPQAVGDTIITEVKGAIIYTHNAKPNRDERITISKVTADGLVPVADNIKHSQDNNGKIEQTPNRTYSAKVSAGLEFGRTYRFTLTGGCSVDVIVPTASAISTKTKLRIYDSKLMPTPLEQSFAYIPLPRIDAGCVNPTPTPSPTPSPSPTSVHPNDPVAVAFGASECSEQYDIMLVLDASGSMRDKNRSDLMKRVVARAIERGKFHGGDVDQLALVTFSSPAVVRQSFTTDFNAVGDKVKAMTFSADASNISRGVGVASQEFATKRRADKPGLVIVISDNKSILGTDGEATAAADAANNRLRYFALSVRDRSNDLVKIARAGKGSYLNVANDSQVNDDVDTLFARIDSLVQSCATLSLSVNPNVLATGEMGQLTFVAVNHTRHSLDDAVVSQSLPAVVNANNSQTVTVHFPAIASGQTASQSVEITGNN